MDIHLELPDGEMCEQFASWSFETRADYLAFGADALSAFVWWCKQNHIHGVYQGYLKVQQVAQEQYTLEPSVEQDRFMLIFAGAFLAMMGGGLDYDLDVEQATLNYSSVDVMAEMVSCAVASEEKVMDFTSSVSGFPKVTFTPSLSLKMLGHYRRAGFDYLLMQYVIGGVLSPQAIFKELLEDVDGVDPSMVFSVYLAVAAMLGKDVKFGDANVVMDDAFWGLCVEPFPRQWLNAWSVRC
ncbi:hypothetical protein ACP3V3_16965 [Vibrio sp. PNB22_3_1]